MKTQPRLYMIGNAHLDPVWLWRWPEGCAEAIGTCWAAVELLDVYPGMIFTRGEAVVYRWIEDLDPALFARIRALVRAGRWVIVNGWWLQPDCNLPSGEAFIRQALYGRRYFRDRFGVEVAVGYNVDSFGHAATIPMLLRHSGFTHYVFMRPMEHEHPLPTSLFDWVAPDGSSVRTFRLSFSYNSSGNWPIARKVEQVQALAAQEGIPLMAFYGVGNHGGGPTRRDLAEIARLQAEGQDLVLSDPVRYFAATDTLARPALQGELQMHAIGCYAAISAIKALNRRAEAALAGTEAAATLALLQAGAPYPHAQLEHLWQTLLFNQFHDILCGSSVRSAARDTEQALGGIIQEAEQLLNTALRRLAATVAPGPNPADATFLVFNLTDSEQGQILEYEPWTGWEQTSYQLLDETGTEAPYQDLQPENYTSRSLHRILCTPRLPAFGYRLFRFVAGTPTLSRPSGLQVTASSLESARWRLEIDPATGCIAALTDKQAGRAIFSGPAHQAVIVADTSDTWSHNLDRFGREGETFRSERVDVLEAGPLRAAVRVRSRAGASTITSTYLLYDDPALPLEIRVSVDWHGHFQLLRLCYPVALPAPTFRYEIPYGSLERPDDGREYPGQRWVLVTGSDGYGLAVANDAKYSYAAQDGVLYLTALRSPVYAHHLPIVLDPEAEYPFVDQGEQHFTIRLQAGTEVNASAAHRLADALMQPPIATPHVARSGAGPYAAGLLEVRTGSSSVTWLKVAEEGEDPILRLVEHEGRADSVALPGSGNQFTVPARGILTLRRDRTGRWHRSDGMEDI
jgi:alpha-mannosidase